MISSLVTQVSKTANEVTSFRGFGWIIGSNHQEVRSERIAFTVKLNDLCPKNLSTR